MTKKSPRSMSSILALSNNDLAGLVRHARRLDQINMALARILQDSVAKHCRVANYRGGQLILHVDSSAWATRLHYQQQQILHALADSGHIEPNSRLEIRIRPQPL